MPPALVEGWEPTPPPTPTPLSFLAHHHRQPPRSTGRVNVSQHTSTTNHLIINIEKHALRGQICCCGWLTSGSRCQTRLQVNKASQQSQSTKPVNKARKQSQPISGEWGLSRLYLRLLRSTCASMGLRVAGLAEPRAFNARPIEEYFSAPTHLPAWYPWRPIPIHVPAGCQAVMAKGSQAKQSGHASRGVRWSTQATHGTRPTVGRIY